MPKELIVAHEPRLFNEDGNEMPQETQSLVQIGWNGEAQYVQIATGTRHPTTFDSDSSTWQFVQLSRTMINDIIKVLRRARDQAYGKDE